MSIEAVRHVLERSKTKGAQRLILLVIAEHADRDGIAWPSVETIARLANCSERFVKATIKKLKAGEIILERGGGRGRSNRYRIPLERVNSGSPITESERVNSEAERVNSDAIKGEPQITRTIKNHQRTISRSRSSNSTQEKISHGNFENAF
jgi:MarR-like DNA-binding transcriptional regulator SgrR of sgrS sRNA